MGLSAKKQQAFQQAFQDGLIGKVRGQPLVRCCPSDRYDVSGSGGLPVGSRHFRIVLSPWYYIKSFYESCIQPISCFMKCSKLYKIFPYKVTIILVLDRLIKVNTALI